MGNAHTRACQSDSHALTQPGTGDDGSVGEEAVVDVLRGRRVARRAPAMSAEGVAWHARRRRCLSLQNRRRSWCLKRWASCRFRTVASSAYLPERVCILNSPLALRAEGKVQRVGVIDLDMHRGVAPRR